MSHTSQRAIGVASDHVIESFRNDLWHGYKTSAGMEPALLAQIPIMEQLLEACGFTVWAEPFRSVVDAHGGPPGAEPAAVAPDMEAGR